jgi:Tol biopolymer transport system component
MEIPGGGGVVRSLTADAGSQNVQPAWSPDGTQIAFSSNRSGTYQIYVLDLSTLAVTRVTNDSAHDYQPNWSRDGTKIAYVSGTGSSAHLYMINPDGTDPVRISTQAAELPDWGLNS